MAAEDQYQIVDIPGIGQREVPANLSGEQLDNIVKQIITMERGAEAEAPSDVPTTENIMPAPTMASDIPTDANLAPTPQAPSETIGEKLIGAGEVARTLGTAAVSDIMGKIKGIGTEVLTGDFGKGTAERVYEQENPFGIYQPQTEAGKRYLDRTAKALGVFEGLPPYAPVPSKFGVRKPTRLGTGTTGSLFDRVPSQEKLGLQAQKLYDNAAKSGVQFKTDAFNEKLLNIGREMRAEGYTPKGNTALSAVFKEGLETRIPKDFTELQAIRKMFKTAASDKSNPDYARQAMIALDKFDDYMLNAPESDFIVAGKKGLDSWKQARIAYSKMKKSELFEDLINNAELKTAEGGNLDRTLLNDLTALSKDKNKMKFFTPDEKARIIKLVKSRDARGIAQRVFSLGGLLAPGFGARAGQFKTALYGGIGGFEAGAGGGIPENVLMAAAGTLGSKFAAEQMRKGGIRDLARFARAGGTEIAPGGSAYQVQLPTGAEYYGTGGLLSNIIDEENR